MRLSFRPESQHNATLSSPLQSGPLVLCFVLLTSLLLSSCNSGSSSSSSNRGSNTGNTPITGPAAIFEGPIGDAGIYGHAMWDHWFDISEVGYVEEEYFVRGTAKTADGSSEADYVTRIIMRRPSDPNRFNGTVLIDWVNVTAQFENAVDTLESHHFFLREGYAYVHASIQAAGLNGTPLTPKVWDPVRYEAINHPGDDYAPDILSQLARGLRHAAGVDPMGNLTVERIIAMGQSQSAIRLHAYVNEVQPSAQAIDGFLIHGDLGAGKDFGAAAPVPVLQLLSDAEAEPEEPSTTENYLLWEVAGTAHQTMWVGEHQVLGQSRRVIAHLPKQPMSEDETLHQIAGNYGEQPDPAFGVCVVAGAAFPMRYAVSAGIHQLDRWIANGQKPPQPPRYEFENGSLASDELGNARGGLRYPPIDVPVARYVSNLCMLGGITIPLTEVELLQRYPSHADYMAQMLVATQRSVQEGFLLPADALELLTRAQAASTRWPLDVAQP